MANLIVGEPLDLTQHQRGPFARGQLEQRLMDHIEPSEMSRVVFHGGQVVLVERRDVTGHTGTPLDGVQGEVGGDTKEPCAGLLVVANLAELLPGAQEGFLAEVIGGLFIAGESPEIAEDIRLAPRDQILEGLVCAQPSAQG